MNKTLFIGGPKDGKREVWPPVGSVYQTATLNGGANPANLSLGITTHTYNLLQFYSPNRMLTIAVHSSIPSAIEQLVKGYRYHRSPRHLLTSRRLTRSYNKLKGLTGAS